MPKTKDKSSPLADRLSAAIAAESLLDVNEISDAERLRAHAREVATKVGRGMLEASDLGTAEHSDDVVVISAGICDLLGIDGVDRDDLLAAARLHDIGKAAIPKRLLEKPGPLTAKEWEVMRTHTIAGEEILAPVKELRTIATLVRHSHERWDGDGYPDGLSGESIPLGSRVIFCADAFHAIRSDRPYRKGRSAVLALEEVARHSGTQFDPNVVEALHEVARELRLAPTAGARVRRSSRLTALLLVLAIGGGSSALARSGLLGDPTAAAAGNDPVVPASTCDALGCVGFSDLLSSASSAGFAGAANGASVASQAAGQAVGAGRGAATEDSGDAPTAGGPGPSSDSTGSPDSDSGGAKGDSTPGNSGSNPHGGPPGKSGDSTPGNSGGNPHGGPPGQSGGSAPGNSGGNPHGGPPGQSKN